MIRVLTVATLLAASLASPSAFAQTGGTNKAFCLQSSAGGDKECNFDTMAQCEGSKKGNAGTCVPNSAASGGGMMSKPGGAMSK